MLISNRPKKCPSCGNRNLLSMTRNIFEDDSGVYCQKCKGEIWYSPSLLEKIISRLYEIKWKIVYFFETFTYRRIKRATIWFWRVLRGQNNWDYMDLIEVNIWKLTDMALAYRKDIKFINKRLKEFSNEDYDEDYVEWYNDSKKKYREVCHLRLLLKNYENIMWSFTPEGRRAFKSKNSLEKSIEQEDGSYLLTNSNPELYKKESDIFHKEWDNHKLFRKRRDAKIYAALKKIPNWLD